MRERNINSAACQRHSAAARPPPRRPAHNGQPRSVACHDPLDVTRSCPVTAMVRRLKKVPRILVTSDDGAVFWNESVRAADFEADHFRGCLADRLGWAVVDAEGPTPPNVRTIQPAPAPAAPHVLDETVLSQTVAA